MKSNKAVLVFCFLIGFDSICAQNLNFSHEFNFQQRLVELSHSSFRPYNEKFHSISYENNYEDSSNYKNRFLGLIQSI